ncbi:hypothetical protein C1645_878108 [Glomus cerebriforme]|uniref:Uncharacterized protein n=1 Tax=Glomus cerebriforme TaxID=658196 RepID=A0A397SMI6_9GLOM|nr:hypothetical protein C1645_878108 [Glomus cerebriforme]
MSYIIFSALQLVAINTKEKLLEDPFENKQRIGNFIRNIPTTLQRNEKKERERERRGTLDSKLETGIFENGNKRSDDSSCHSMGCSYSPLYYQHWRTSNANFSQLSDGMAISTFKTVSKVDNDFRANAHEDATMTDSIKYDVKIKQQGNYEGLIQNISNRKQGYQKSNNKVSRESQFRELTSFFSERSWEFGKESSTLAVQELCQNEYMIPSSVTDIRAANQNLCNNNKKSKTDSMLRELHNDHETQNLIRLLKDKKPYRDEINKDVLFDYEIQFFAKTYGITEFFLVFACGDWIFWLEDHGVIYFWSRIDDSMIHGGENLKEALTNYLFNQENLCYVDEITRKLVPINAYDKEAEGLVKPPEAYINIDVTKVSQA